jgi:hypothetical protein
MWLVGGSLYVIAAWIGRPPWLGEMLKDKPARQLVLAGFVWIGASLLAWPVFLAARIVLWLRRGGKS